MVDNSSTPERPRLEPEIIPPDRWRGGSGWRPQPFTEAAGMHRIYVTRLGPFAGVLLLLVLVALAVVGLLAFVGALLLWIPLLALVVVVAAFSGFLRTRRW